MCDSFFYIKRSHSLLDLLKTDMNAANILTVVAMFARISKDEKNGLEEGEMWIRRKDTGIKTREQFDGALKRLEKMGQIQIISRNKNNSITHIKGTKVKLLKSDCYALKNSIETHQGHINAHIEGHITPHITSPSVNQEKDTSPHTSLHTSPHTTYITNDTQTNDTHKRKVKKKVFSEEEEKEYLEFSDRKFVKITQAEYDKLANNPEIGKEMLEDMLDTLECWLGQKPRDKFHHYYALKKGGWVRKKCLDEKVNSKKPTMSIREKVLSKFKNGDISNGYECFINEEAIAFTCLNGPTHHQLPFRISGFEDQLQNIIYKIKWKQNLEIAK